MLFDQGRVLVHNYHKHTEKASLEGSCTGHALSLPAGGCKNNRVIFLVKEVLAICIPTLLRICDLPSFLLRRYLQVKCRFPLEEALTVTFSWVFMSHKKLHREGCASQDYIHYVLQPSTICRVQVYLYPLALVHIQLIRSSEDYGQELVMSWMGPPGLLCLGSKYLPTCRSMLAFITFLALSIVVWLPLFDNVQGTRASLLRFESKARNLHNQTFMLPIMKFEVSKPLVEA